MQNYFYLKNTNLAKKASQPTRQEVLQSTTFWLHYSDAYVNGVIMTDKAKHVYENKFARSAFLSGVPISWTPIDVELAELLDNKIIGSYELVHISRGEG